VLKVETNRNSVSVMIWVPKLTQRVVSAWFQ